MSLSCNGKVFAQYFFVGLFHSLVVFLIPVWSLQTNIVSEKGDTENLWLLSVTSFTCVVFIVTINLAVFTRTFNILVTLAFIIPSILFYLVYMWSTNWLGDKMDDSIIMSHLSPLFYFNVLLCVSLCFFVDYFVLSFRMLAFPTPSKWLQYHHKRKTVEVNEEQFYSIVSEYHTL